MKIAITAIGNSMNSPIDKRFGRCTYFVIYDDKTGSVEFTPNSAKDSEQGSGIAAVEFIASRGVNKIISGEFGIKIKSLFDSLKIQMIMIKQHERTVGETIDLLKQSMVINK